MNAFDQRRYLIWREEFQTLQDDTSIMSLKEAYESRSRRSENMDTKCIVAYLTSLFPGFFIARKGTKKLYALKEE